MVSLLNENDPYLDLIDRIDMEYLLRQLDQPMGLQSQAIPIMTSNKKKSDKFPALALNANVQAFVKLTSNEIQNLKIKKATPSNLSVEEQDTDTLSNVTANPMITVKPSDKGGNILIMDNVKYVSICTRILNNKAWCEYYCKQNRSLST